MAGDKLYINNSYLDEFEAEIVRIKPAADGRWAVVLDRTAFYPASGGQPCDTGTLGDSPVVDVEERCGEVVHMTTACPDAGNGSIKGKVDWDRRFDHMQQHTGQHILSGAFWQELGLATVGFHMGAAVSHIDIDTPALHDDDVALVENLANRIVFENKSVIIHYADKESLSQFTLRKCPVKDFAAIRVIDIGGFDCSPCGGTHLARTGEAGLIKVRNWSKKNGAMRVEFVCGGRALADYRQKNTVVAELSALLSAPVESLADAAVRQQAKIEGLEKQLSAAKRDYYELLAGSLADQAEQIRGVTVVAYALSGVEPADVAALAQKIASRMSCMAFIAGVTPGADKVHMAFACSENIKISMDGLLKLVLPFIGGKGGGSGRMARGGGPLVKGLEEALAHAKAAIIEKLDTE